MMDKNEFYDLWNAAYDSGLGEEDFCAFAAKLLEGAFVWSHTDEGHAYWRKVVERLREMADGADAPEIKLPESKNA